MAKAIATMLLIAAMVGFLILVVPIAARKADREAEESAKREAEQRSREPKTQSPVSNPPTSPRLDRTDSKARGVDSRGNNSGSGQPEVDAADAPSEEAKANPEVEALKVPPQDDERTGPALTSIYVDGQRISIPVGWEHESKDSNGLHTEIWRGPEFGAYIRLDISETQADPLETMLAEEARFKRSSARYEYKRTRLRTGSEAYLGGAIWNFRISKDNGPMHRRTIAYFNKNNKSYGLLVNIEDAHFRELSGVLTSVLDSLNSW